MNTDYDMIKKLNEKANSRRHTDRIRRLVDSMIGKQQY